MVLLRFCTLEKQREKEKERGKGTAYYPGIIVARFIGRIGSEIGKPQICFGHCYAARPRTLFRVQRLRASTLETRARAGQVNESRSSGWLSAR